MYFRVSAAHCSADEEEEDVAALEVLVPVPEVFGTLTVVRVEAEVAAATANLLLTATVAAVEDELTFAGLELVLVAELVLVLALEVPLELAFVLRVVETAEELVTGVLEVLEAKEAALELAFRLELEATLEVDLMLELATTLELATFWLELALVLAAWAVLEVKPV